MAKKLNLATASAILGLLSAMTTANAAVNPPSQNGYYIAGYFFASSDVAADPSLLQQINTLLQQNPNGLVLELNGVM
ncbi:MAG: hypothetical protein K6T31_02340, partial [Alicyclobacillus sp.]|nr:hypothetical protein [Alicyclobacillus sp.]